jgi:hypothetical protein
MVELRPVALIVMQRWERIKLGRSLTPQESEVSPHRQGRPNWRVLLLCSRETASENGFSLAGFARAARGQSSALPSRRRRE